MTLLEALRGIRENGPTHRSMGICHQVATAFVEDNNVIPDTYFCEQMDAMIELCRRWPRFSGSSSYPVPAADHSSPADAYVEARGGGMWDTRHPYGAARWELLDFMITELEKDLEQ